jgi:NAD-dependent SIR2 family protein deacetylase
MIHRWYTQNEDYPQLNDENTVELLGDVLTLDCNGCSKSYKVSGVLTSNDLKLVEVEHKGYPVCPEDPTDCLNALKLRLVSPTELPQFSALRPLKL